MEYSNLTIEGRLYHKGGFVAVDISNCIIASKLQHIIKIENSVYIIVEQWTPRDRITFGCREIQVEICNCIIFREL